MMMIRRRISTIITITTIIKWKEGPQRRHEVKYYRRDTDTLADGDKYDRIVTISTTMARSEILQT